MYVYMYMLKYICISLGVFTVTLGVLFPLSVVSSVSYFRFCGCLGF